MGFIIWSFRDTIVGKMRRKITWLDFWYYTVTATICLLMDEIKVSPAKFLKGFFAQLRGFNFNLVKNCSYIILKTTLLLASSYKVSPLADQESSQTFLKKLFCLLTILWKLILLRHHKNLPNIDDRLKKDRISFANFNSIAIWHCG